MYKLSHKIYTQQTLKIFNATYKNKDSFGIFTWNPYLQSY